MRTNRNVLQGSLTLDEAKYVFGPEFTWHFPKVTVGLSSLAMGDFCHCCAVEFAQCSHLGLLLQHGVSKVAELLSLSGAIPRVLEASFRS